jgi:hypothetical protein
VQRKRKTRQQPTPPFPAQHQARPGLEARLDPAPRFEAPAYVGSDKLLGKVALITGGDSGIGRATAVLFAREGADVAITCLAAEAADAAATREAVALEGRGCHVLRADLRDRRACDRVVAATVKHFGRLDILENNAA